MINSTSPNVPQENTAMHALDNFAVYTPIVGTGGGKT